MGEKTAVIIGVGPEKGLGATLCRRFAKQGLHVFAAGRTQTKLDAVAASIRSEGGSATGVETDATDEAAVTALIRQAEGVGPIDLAVYNAGNNMPGAILEMEAAYFEKCWRIGCYGGFLFSREALKAMAPRGAGTLLFTGASASLRGKPFFAAFTAAKAGLRALSQSLAREFAPQGIHVAHVVIDGGIDGEKLQKGRPDVAKAFGPERLINLDGVAGAYEYLYLQDRLAWSQELDLRAFKEPF